MKKYLSTSEAAELLGVDRVTVYRWIKNGTLKAIKIGKSFAVLEEELDKLPRMRKKGKGAGTDQKTTEEQIRNAVKRVVREYGKTLKKLGSE